jgi:hypothetical protein
MIVAAIWLIQTINGSLEDAHSKLFFPKYARQFIWLQSSAKKQGTPSKIEILRSLATAAKRVGFMRCM